MAIERLSITQVAAELGTSKKTVYRLMAEGLLGYTQATDRTRLVRRDQLEAYLEARDVYGKYDRHPLVFSGRRKQA